MTTDDKVKLDSNDDDEIVKVALERFKLADEAESENKRDGVDDLNFLSGDQWPDEIKQDRNQQRRPCLVINRLPQQLRQVTNDQRQNRSSIKVTPVDEHADIETAKVFQGLIRHIEYNSNADVAYNRSFEASAGKGLGYYRVITDYCDPNSFDQEILIKSVRNSFSVLLDPNSQEPDGSDANWGFVFQDMSKEDFKAQFPDAKLSSEGDWSAYGSVSSNWIRESTVRVGEYFYKTFKKVDLVLLSNGQSVDKSEIPKELPQGLTIIKERKTTLPAIKWCKLNGLEILDKTDWLGAWIPIIPVIGDELDIDGKRVLSGIIRAAKDPQRALNFWKSAEAEIIALAPKAPFIGVEGQFEGHEHEWQTANTKNHAYLEYKASSISGQPVGPPTRNMYEAPVQAITQAGMQASEDIKATTGIYDSALGNQSNENSGIAIQKRNNQSQTSNFHLIDNLNISKRHLGRILVDLIPKVYDAPRTIRILGEDDSAEMVAINQIFPEDAKQKTHMLSAGKYDVSIGTGPDFATKREEAAQMMLEFVKVVPNAGATIGDLIAGNMDWNGAEEISERLRKTLPPGIADDKNSDKKPIPPEVQAQLQQAQQMVQQLTEHLNQKTKLVEEKTLELESRERIEMAKLESQASIELARLQAKDAHAILDHQINEINRRLDLLNMNQPIENETGSQGPSQATQPQQQPQPMGV